MIISQTRAGSDSEESHSHDLSGSDSSAEAATEIDNGRLPHAFFGLSGK